MDEKKTLAWLWQEAQFILFVGLFVLPENRQTENLGAGISKERRAAPERDIVFFSFIFSPKKGEK